jgi:hypothetical protein
MGSGTRDFGENGGGASLLGEKPLGLRANGFGLRCVGTVGIDFEIGVQVRQKREQIALAKVDLGKQPRRSPSLH